MTKHLVVTRAAEKAAYVAGIVVVVYSKLSALTSSPLADVAPATLRLVNVLVLLGCNAVGLTNVLRVVVVPAPLLQSFMVRKTSRPRILSFTMSCNTFGYTVLASLLLSRQSESPYTQARAQTYCRHA